VVALEVDPVADESDYCARNGVGLSAARNHGWIIRPVGTSMQDGAVLGCIEDSEDQFELIQLVGGFRWSIHDSFHNALQQLVRELPQLGNERVFDNECDPPHRTTFAETGRANEGLNGFVQLVRRELRLISLGLRDVSTSAAGHVEKLRDLGVR
jgi:hypothetical protein